MVNRIIKLNINIDQHQQCSSRTKSYYNLLNSQRNTESRSESLIISKESSSKIGIWCKSSWRRELTALFTKDWICSVRYLLQPMTSLSIRQWQATIKNKPLSNINQWSSSSLDNCKFAAKNTKQWTKSAN